MESPSFASLAGLELSYPNPDNPKKIRVECTENSAGFRFRRWNPALGECPESAKPQHVSGAAISKLAKALKPHVPVDVEDLFGASGNSRSVLEAAFAASSHCFIKHVNGRKHLVYEPGKSHPLGEVAFLP